MSTLPGTHGPLRFGGAYLDRMRILFAEDEPTIRTYVALGLREAGYAIDVADNGEDALALARVVPYDALILDITMPGIDGLEVCRRLRGSGLPGAPVLFLTARDAVEDRVIGLDAGAEDYLVKPFALAELLARVRALLRRGGGAPPVLRVADLTLDPAAHQATRAGIDIRLTAKEFALLEYLMRNAGTVQSKTMIADHVWDLELDGETNFIEVLIHGLRKKVDFPFDSSVIQTVRGVGYRIDASLAAP